MTLYAAIDLHATNNVLVVIDDNDALVYKPKRLPNDPAVVLEQLEPFKEQLKAVAVESTFNWYWLGDALQAQGYELALVHTPAIKQYEGLKHGDDDSDAFHLAQLMRLGILPTGHVCPHPVRELRDAMRRREALVQQGTKCVLSLQSMYARILAERPAIDALDEDAITKAFPRAGDRHAALALWAVRCEIRLQTDLLDRWIVSELKQHSKLTLSKICAIPGIGVVLGPMILLETGPIGRFASVGNYASYCRMVDTRRLSNDKRKGRGNRKSGNGHLCWAYIEAANFAVRFSPTIRRWFDRKLSQVKLRVIAIKAVAHKLARAVYFMLRDDKPFDVDRGFH
jgi:transposase